MPSAIEYQKLIKSQNNKNNDDIWYTLNWSMSIKVMRSAILLLWK